MYQKKKKKKVKKTGFFFFKVDNIKQCAHFLVRPVFQVTDTYLITSFKSNLKTCLFQKQ